MPEFPPGIPLKGGPYDGRTTAELSDVKASEYGVLFFPDRVHALGPDGLAVYALHESKGGMVGEYDPEGK